MSDRESFLRSILDDPEDDAPRLVFADWLEEQGDAENVARAEFIRSQIERTKIPPTSPRAKALRKRERELFPQYAAKWRANLPEWARGHADFRRGFVGKLRMTALRFVRHAKTLMAAVPLEAVRLHAAETRVPQLAATAELARLRELDLRSNRFGAAARDLFASPHFPRLVSLNLAADFLGDAALQTLLARSLFDRLRELDLYGNGLTAESVRPLAACAGLKNLTLLNLRSNSIHSAGARALAESPHLTGLTELHLSYNPIGEEGFRALAGSPNLSRLTVLTLGYISAGPAAEALFASLHLGELRRLDLQQNRLTDRAAEALAACPRLHRLERLDLYGNQIGETGVRALANSPYLKRLKYLQLGSNQVGDAGARALLESPTLRRLRSLHIFYNGLSDAMRGRLRKHFGNRVHL